MNNQVNDSARAELAYAITYAGAIGSAVIASFFLILDTLAGRPLETPILLGSAIFLGEIGSQSGTLRLDLAAAYSLLHFGLFAAVGAVFALVAERLRGHPNLLPVLVGGLFVTLSAGLVTLDALVAPSLVATIGLAPMVLGNLLASCAMTAFYARAYEIGEARVRIPTTLIGDSE